MARILIATIMFSSFAWAGVAPALAAAPAINVTGTWQFSPGGNCFIPGGAYTLRLRQQGATLTGTLIAGGGGGTGTRVRGSVHGNNMSFNIRGTTPDESFGGHGTVNAAATTFSGTCWDGIGGSDTLTGQKIH